MDHHVLTSLAAIIVLGISAQWIAWRLNVPSILLLLTTGIVAGPAVLGFLEPDHLLGDLLLPFVSLSVAIILFEGGLTLKISEIQGIRDVVGNLISLGIVVTWGLTTLIAHFILDLNWNIALLLGAILVVTGPTVILPMLRQIRPSGRVGSVLKWEGILIDPIGAVLALLVFEQVIISESIQQSTLGTILVIVKTLAIGLILGVVSARLLVTMFRRYWVPDHLQNPVTLMVLIGSFAISNQFQAESGLLTATVMGIVLANQSQVSLRHVVEFKETLGVLLLSGLFIILAARLDTEAFEVFINIESVIFLAILIVMIRPLSVWISTFRTDLEIKEQLFLSTLAPRGIVAAAVSSIFALELEEAGYAQADLLVPYTFEVIIGTVLIYGLAAGPIARWLKLAKPDPQGVLIVGAHTWAREIGMAIQKAGFPVNLVDINQQNTAIALYEGLPASSNNVLSESFLEQIDFGNLGRLVALTPNNEVNTLAALNFSEIFTRAEVYRLSVKETELGLESSHGRTLFSEHATFDYIEDQFYNGAEIETREVDRSTWNTTDFLPMFVIDPETEKLSIWTDQNPPTPKIGHKVIGMKAPSPQIVVDPEKDEEAETIAATLSETENEQESDDQTAEAELPDTEDPSPDKTKEIAESTEPVQEKPVEETES